MKGWIAMEERSVRVYRADKTFFAKISSTITKLLIPTKVGINSVLIAMKRNNVIKAFELQKQYAKDEIKQEEYRKKQEDMYALYLEVIDKHIMDSIYNKVRNETASIFEKEALANYYNIIHLKDSEYIEYKYKKQRYLLRLDYEAVKESGKPRFFERYKRFYLEKVEALYKGLLKHYSVKLSDNLSYANKEEVYGKIFVALEEYITQVLPLKLEVSADETYASILEEYEKFENFTVGKLDQNDSIEKSMILLGISRKLFTHSLPLIVAEQCYIKLLKDIRALIVDTRVEKKQEKAYALLIKLIEEYNIRLLSTKIYWEKPADRDSYKKFWDSYQAINQIKDTDRVEYKKQKEILFIRGDLEKVLCNPERYAKIIAFYRNRLVELGVMRQMPNQVRTIQGRFVKQKQYV